MNESLLNPVRSLILLGLISGSLLLLMAQAPIGQDPAYHAFVDARSFWGIPNFYNVLSNLPFLFVGVAGALFCLGQNAPDTRLAWLCFFVGVGLVGFGSAYYHLVPGNQRLLWDRLPMTAGFMGMFAAVLGEFVDERLTRYLLLPLILTGLGSVLIWQAYDDLRLYAWVQFMPLLVIPALLVLYRNRYTHGWLMVPALTCYLVAKLLEAYDARVFHFLQNQMGGHAIKHVFAAMAGAMILAMLQIRKTSSVLAEPAVVKQAR